MVFPQWSQGVFLLERGTMVIPFCTTSLVFTEMVVIIGILMCNVQYYGEYYGGTVMESNRSLRFTLVSLVR